ncbi:TIGR03085 family metal-binding protein [Actinomadura opuntiae]|uniref:TIGR03085 family metal-binding protein n=1 Tax=Actinomadura sp. OS1-43 TaxID=604315 RepID=UPI00255A9910|nr:TIGR03085 family metal-binding protein [Actinomadura sp. OS1-43]MDL4821583.1 TIGR03085 family metal-binding protein [Actinomadura sp. OS1-43]
MSTPEDDPVRRERGLLAGALAEAGPDAPTRCGGWDARDLAAHLVVREGRPDAGPGILLPPLAFYTERVRRRTARALPFERLVERFGQGPPKFSPYALPGVDKIANGVEFFVHHEDIRRARPDWEPRELSGELEELLWRRIKIARFVLRKVHVEVTLVRPDGRSARVSGGGRARGGGGRGGSGGGSGPVRVHGPVGELVLWALGRTDVARVRLTGPTDSVKTLTETGWSL